MRLLERQSRNAGYVKMEGVAINLRYAHWSGAQSLKKCNKIEQLLKKKSKKSIRKREKTSTNTPTCTQVAKQRKQQKHLKVAF